MPFRIFLSHAAANEDLARALAEALEQSGEGVEVFVSSRPGDIGAHAAWLSAVEDALAQADAFLILLTPESIGRPWIAFEAGVAWSSNKIWVLARVSALAADDIPSPLNTREIYAIDQAEPLATVFAALKRPVRDISQVAERLLAIDQATQRGGLAEPAWEGVTLDGAFYAWSGPLIQMQDRDDAVAPQGLMAALRDRGADPAWATRLDRAVERGSLQVFATDRRSWKRAIASGLGKLVVRR
jgi:hypothetical protein